MYMYVCIYGLTPKTKKKKKDSQKVSQSKKTTLIHKA